MKVPFNRPWLAPQTFAYLAETFANGHTSGDGPFTRRTRLLLNEILDERPVLLTTSGTHALEMIALLLAIGPGDEVVMPSFTFVSTANAFVLRGATPVFVDVRRDTCNLDERLLEAAISDRTKAIVAVHYAGVACEMDAIIEVAGRYGLPVVEDNAHGLAGRYRGRPLGTLGVMAALSFHETKNFSCGEGGALVVNDPRYLDRAEVLREKGTNRRRFFAGQVDKYTWVDVGSSYLPSDILAACLLAQLESRAEVLSRRRKLWHRYAEALAAWAATEGVAVPVIPDDRESAYHMFHIVCPDPAHRSALLKRLNAAGVTAVFHYQSLHRSAFGRQFARGALPVTESLSETLVRLPFYTGMSEEEQEFVIHTISRA
ncbi:MAG: dTDP-4-amino-4,6-dideoxygalactose transaminase [Gemmatimonadaceae bacterium]